MGKNYNIYISDEAMQSLERKKKKGDFNLSGFVSNQLLKEDVTIMGNVEEIQREIQEKKIKMLELEADILNLNHKIEVIIQSDKAYQEKVKENDKKEKELKDIYHYQMAMSEEEKEEYNKGLKDGKYKTLMQYIKIKLGYV